ncbi:MAG: hypothetical protein P4L76_13075 [Beijerinckiaceae bacterium]|nr:hypothetical protein [Beijerinckiaceae bacterium]
MNFLLKAAFVTIGLGFATAAMAEDEYNTVPAGDAQYASCLKFSATQYEGGKAASPIKGQTKAEAWCTCMWNETPEDFKGSLGKFSETAKGKSTNKTCEKYADWGN